MIKNSTGQRVLGRELQKALQNEATKQYLDNNQEEKRGGKEMNAKIKVDYEFVIKDENEAIDIKNKIIANTLDDEEVNIRFHHTRTF